MSKPNPKIKSFQLYEGKTPIHLIGLVLVVALFFIGLILLFAGGVNRQIVKNGNQNSSVVNRCDVPGKKCVGSTVTPANKIIDPEDVEAPTVIPVVNKQGALPEGFPEDIPLYESVQIVESNSFKNVPNGNIVQSLVVYQSNKKVEDVSKFYENWAKKNTWQVTENNVNQTKSVANLSFSRENKRLAIRLEKLLFNTTRVSMAYETIDTQKIQQNFDQIIKNLKLEDIKQ